MEKRGSGFQKITTHTSELRLYSKDGNTTQKTTPKDENSTPKKLGATAQSILDILSEDPYLKREEIATRAGLKLEGLKYQLAQLQKKGYLLRTEGRKTGRWKVLIKK